MSEQISKLLTALRKLKAQSADGFEGLLRDCLEIVCGRTLRLVKSGPQRGNDFASDADPLLPGIAFEAKRFGAKTALPVDELKSKLREAIEYNPLIDVWALVRTGEQKHPDWPELEQIGRENGVAVLCLDWRSGPGSLPVIAALCTAGRHAAEKLLGQELRGVFDEIEQHPYFSRIIEDLRRQLVSSEAGFESAQTAAKRWLKSAVESVSSSRTQLRSHANLLSADAGYLSRPAIDQSLENWWAVGGTSPVVILGDEGTGKTWAALGWCLKRLEADGSTLVLVSSAKDLAVGGADDLLAELLGRSMPVIDHPVLARRLKRWVQRESAVRILLLIDGVNEGRGANCPELVRIFDVAPWKGKVSLIFTSRTAYWREEFAGSFKSDDGASDAIAEIEARPFGQSELTSYLTAFGLSRDDLPTGLLELMRTPRFARLAISLRSKLGNTEDLTVARLVLEDWRARLQDRRDLRLDDESLIEFVSGLGKDVRSDNDFVMSAREIHERLAKDSGRDLEHYKAAIDELVSGLWLNRTDRPFKYKVNPKLLPYAIGLDLAQCVSGLTDRASIEQIIAEYEEQLRGADIGVAILRAAASISFSRKATRGARAALIKAWVSSQNFGRVDFDEMWPLVGRDPTIFCDFAEAHWKQHPMHRGEGEILAKALANAAKWPNVHEMLADRFPKWVGSFGLDPIAWDHGKDLPKADQREARVRANLASWHAVQPRYSRPIHAYLRESEQDHLPDAALAIMSYLERAPFMDAIATWAITRAIMGTTTGLEQFEWLLRLNTDDDLPLQHAVLQEVSTLRGLRNDVATAAADLLVDALASPRAAHGMSQTAKAPLRVISGWPYMSGGIVTWEKPGGGAQEVNSLLLTERLAPFALARLATLPEIAIAEVGDIVRLTADDAGWQNGSNLQSSPVVMTLARWGPRVLGQITRDFYARLPDLDLEAVRGVLHDLPEACLVLGAAERERLLAGGLARLGEASDASRVGEKKTVRRSQSMMVAGVIGEDATRQIELLVKLLPTFAFPTDLARFLSVPSLGDVKHVLNRLKGAGDERELLSWLGYLTEVARGPWPANAGLLAELAIHSSASVREAAISAMLVAGDSDVGRAFADSSWRHREGQDRIEAIGGTYLLAEFGGHCDFASISKRIVPQALPLLAEKRGNQEHELGLAFAYVEGLLDAEIQESREPKSGYGNRFVARTAWRAIVDMKDGLLIKKTLLAAKANRLTGFFNIFPLIDLLAAILESRPAEGADIWRLVKKTHRRNSLTMGDFDLLPFFASDHAEISRLRTEALDSARTDDDLTDIVFALLKGQREQWLITFVLEDLKSASAWRAARGLTLAGLLDNTENADALWNLTIGPLCLPDWLATVRQAASERYERNVDACHWLEMFLATQTRDEAYGFLKLFLKSIDVRYALWAPAMFNKFRKRVNRDWLSHFDATKESRKRELKLVEDNRKRELFSTRTAGNVAPWL